MSRFTSLHRSCIHLSYTTRIVIRSRGCLDKGHKLALNITDVNDHRRRDGRSGQMDWKRRQSPLLSLWSAHGGAVGGDMDMYRFESSLIIVRMVYRYAHIKTEIQASAESHCDERGVAWSNAARWLDDESSLFIQTDGPADRRTWQKNQVGHISLVPATGARCPLPVARRA